MSDIVVLDGDLSAKPNLEAIGLNADIVAHTSSRPADVSGHERVIYFLSLSAGGLKYQVDLIWNNPEIQQWILLITSKPHPGMTWGIESSLNSVQSSVKILNVYGKSDAEIKILIDSIPPIHAKKFLIYSKRESMGKRTVATFLKKNFCPGWNFETCTGSEEVLREKCSGIPRVIIMGRSLQDFSLSKPDDLESEPAFLFYPYDEEVQSCINPSSLWDDIRSVLAERKWIFQEKYRKFYVASALYEQWTMNESNPVSLLNEDFVMWDSFGLPLTRNDYTEDKAQNFLAQFHGLKDLASEFLR